MGWQRRKCCINLEIYLLVVGEELMLPLRKVQTLSFLMIRSNDGISPLSPLIYDALITCICHLILHAESSSLQEILFWLPSWLLQSAVLRFQAGRRLMHHVDNYGR